MISKNTTSIIGVMFAPIVGWFVELGTRMPLSYLNKTPESDTLLIMKDHTTFVKTFVRHPTRVGAIAPSSTALARAMVNWFDWDSVRNVVEFGSGTGVFTRAIRDSLHPEARFFAVDRSPSMVRTARRRCPDVKIYEDCVTNVAQLCQQESMSQVDVVISGLPWASFSRNQQSDAFDAMLEVLVPAGRFATFAYLQGMLLPGAKQFSDLLADRFSTVQRSKTVWRNVPPAFVYRCIR